MQEQKSLSNPRANGQPESVVPNSNDVPNNNAVPNSNDVPNNNAIPNSNDVPKSNAAPTEKLVGIFRENIRSEAESLVLKDIPKKIQAISLDLEKFCNQNYLAHLHCDLKFPIQEDNIQNEAEEPAAKRLKSNPPDEVQANSPEHKVVTLPSGFRIPFNKKVAEITDVVKPRIKQIVEDTVLLKMWIHFLIPRIEDGNNFGVSIQEETLAEIRSVERKAVNFYEQLSRYFLARGNTVVKVAKYPFIEDFRRTVNELDEKQFDTLLFVLCELRNDYAMLYDLITKNMEKIKKPRNVNTEMMY